MLVEFTVGNYRSFRDPVTLSMTPAKISSKDKRLDTDNIFDANERTRLLKSAAVYGANASGKSNLVQAMSLMQDLVLSSFAERRATTPIDVREYRLDTETVDQPSLFEVVFISLGKQYRYGFEVSRNRVESEWLFWVPTRQEARLFVREGKEIKTSKRFAKEAKGLQDKTRPDVLFLSVVAQFNGPIAMEILEWFERLQVLSGLDDAAGRWHSLQGFTNDAYRTEITDFVKHLDLGIEDIHVEDIHVEKIPLPETVQPSLFGYEPQVRIVISTLHQMYGSGGKVIGTEKFDLDKDESDGTKKLFSIAGLVLDALQDGGITIVDELDARLHPLITRALVRMFHDTETNRANAQLIFTTHDTNLLDKALLRRDQIWLTEKDRRGCSHLHSLVEYKVRNDASYEKDYLRGKYGAIPFINVVERIGEDSDA